jgi:hypothetical protein
VYVWTGLYIPDGSDIYIAFHDFKNENWFPKKQQDKLKNVTGGKYYDNTVTEGGNYYVHLKDIYYEQFCAGNVDAAIQKDIIKKFLEEITAAIA